MLRGPWQLRSVRRSHLTEQRQNNDNNKGIVDNNNEQSPSTLTQTQFGMGEVWSRRWALKNAQKIVCKKFKRGIFAHAHTLTHKHPDAHSYCQSNSARTNTLTNTNAWNFFAANVVLAFTAPKFAAFLPQTQPQPNGLALFSAFCFVRLCCLLVFCIFCFSVLLLKFCRFPFPLTLRFAFDFELALRAGNCSRARKGSIKWQVKLIKQTANNKNRYHLISQFIVRMRIIAALISRQHFLAASYLRRSHVLLGRDSHFMDALAPVLKHSISLAWKYTKVCERDMKTVGE